MLSLPTSKNYSRFDSSHAPEDCLGSPQPTNQPRSVLGPACAAGAFGGVDRDEMFFSRMRSSEPGVVDEVRHRAVALFRLPSAQRRLSVFSVRFGECTGATHIRLRHGVDDALLPGPEDGLGRFGRESRKVSEGVDSQAAADEEDALGA